MKRQPAPRWLVGLCCFLAAVAAVLALVLGGVILVRRQTVSLTPPAAQRPPSQPVSVQPEPKPEPEPPSALPAEEEAETDFHTLDSVLLYRVQDNLLEYDVTHTVSVENAAVIDLTGTQITSLAQLTACLEEQTWAFTADLILDGGEHATAVCLTDRVLRPKIGISWKADSQDYREYKEILLRNGACPVELPQITCREEAQAALEQVAGLMVTGGEDIDPALYGDEITPNGSNDINSVRDTSDYWLIRQAIDQDLPMLAICRGAQMLNVVLGGGLIQDIPTYLSQEGLPSAEETGILHKGGTRYHDIDRIDPDSKWMYDIVGAERYPNAATFHHQALDPNRLGQGLTPVAWTADGIIEAVEYQSNRFALGIQFHPERDALGDTLETDTDQDTCNRFLRALVEAAESES